MTVCFIESLEMRDMTVPPAHVAQMVAVPLFAVDLAWVLLHQIGIEGPRVGIGSDRGGVTPIVVKRAIGWEVDVADMAVALRNAIDGGIQLPIVLIVSMVIPPPVYLAHHRLKPVTIAFERQ